MRSLWRPSGKIVRIAWTKPEAYGFARRRLAARSSAVVMLLGPVALGLLGAAALQWGSSEAPQSGSTSAIEWNAVQAVPTRAPDPQDAEWERRAKENSAAGSAFAGAQQPTPGQVASEDTPSPGNSAASSDLYVIDGDTFSYRGERVRILGMDAPETHPPRCIREAQLGLAATAKLKQLLSSGAVTMSGSGRDRYGRALRQVFVNGVDVAQDMIAAGLASSYSGGKRQAWC